jgi:hypothetical protein
MTGYLIPAPPFVSPKATVVAKAADATLTAAEVNGKQITNTGAGAGIALTLPDPATVGGCSFRVQITVAQTVKLTPPATKKVFLGGSGVASKYAEIAGVIGNYADVTSDGVDYMITAYSGVVTKEA